MKNNEKAFKQETFLIISDYSIDVCAKTLYDNYFNWAGYIKNALLNNNYKLVSATIENLAHRVNAFFCLPIDTVLTYVMEFFIYNHYQKMYEIVRLIRKVQGSYISKKIN